MDANVFGVHNDPLKYAPRAIMNAVYISPRLRR